MKYSELFYKHPNDIFRPSRITFQVALIRGYMAIEATYECDVHDHDRTHKTQVFDLQDRTHSS